MTGTALVIDRLAPTPSMVGERPTMFVRYDDSVDGLWCNHGYIWCTELSPGSFACSRPQGHPAHWAHCAASEDRIHAVWGGVAVVPDPFWDITVGTRANDTPGSQDEVSGFYLRDTNQWCREQSPDPGAICSRAAGHPTHWRHIAAGGTVISVWGGAEPYVDRWAAVRANEYLVDLGRAHSDNVTGVRVESGEYCRELNTEAGHDTGSFCTRAVDHQGQHISTSARRVLWVKPNTTVFAPPGAVVEPIDPPDGTPDDPEDAVLTVAPEVGTVVRLRDRENRLYVMLSKRRESDEVEVLDLKNNEIRALKLDRLVTSSEPVLTMGELESVAKWYAGHRDSVRKVAVREYRNDRWCRDGLNSNLAQLGLEKYVPTLRGDIWVKLPFDCPDVHATQSTIEAKVNAALANPEVQAALRLALPVIEEIELDSAAMSVSAQNFSRK